MEKKELFSLRDQLLEFNDLEKFTNKVKDFFGKNLEFPMIVGYKDFPPESNWNIKELSPRGTSDKLTIENYFESLNQIIDGRKPDKFRGMINFEGIDSLHYSNWDSNIFWAMMRLDKSAEYYLSIYFSRNNKTGKIGYAATSRKEETIYDNIMSRFLGPNRKYERLLS
jgi:hypothetical protein